MSFNLLHVLSMLVILENFSFLKCTEYFQPNKRSKNIWIEYFGRTGIRLNPFPTFLVFSSKYQQSNYLSIFFRFISLNSCICVSNATNVYHILWKKKHFNNERLFKYNIFSAFVVLFVTFITSAIGFFIMWFTNMYNNSLLEVIEYIIFHFIKR